MLGSFSNPSPVLMENRFLEWSSRTRAFPCGAPNPVVVGLFCARFLSLFVVVVVGQTHKYPPRLN